MPARPPDFPVNMQHNCRGYPVEVRVRRWVEMGHEFLQRVAADPRCPVEVQAEAHRLQVMCESLGAGDARAWWPDLSEHE